MKDLQREDLKLLLEHVENITEFAEHDPPDAQVWKALDEIQWSVNKFFYDHGRDATMYKVGGPPPCPRPPCT